jgi:hypothetical protein
MAFSQSLISDVSALQDGPEIYVSWTSSAPPGTTFQVYVDRRLTWYGPGTFCHIPIPADSQARNVWIEVGTVGPGEGPRDFSQGLSGPGGTGPRAILTWLGGSYLDPTGHDDVRSFKIYQSSAPGGPVNFGTAVATIAVYPGGTLTDGFGLGGFGSGGFGRAASSYSWTSDPLGSGAWTFAVVPYDHAGNAQGTPGTTSVTIAAAPRPPAGDANGDRLTYSYAGPATRQVALNWLASPS